MNHCDKLFYCLLVLFTVHFPHIVTGKNKPNSCKSTGLVSYYSSRFAGRRTSSGEKYHPDSFTCAHHRLPFGTRIIVTNLKNGKQVGVRVNDRLSPRSGRMVDLSRCAAAKIDMLREGVVKASLVCRDSL